MKKEIHLQFSGCSWNAIPVMCYVAFTTVLFVGNLARTCYRTFTATQMIAICKVNERKNEAVDEIKLPVLPFEAPGVHMNSFKRVRALQIELEFGSVGF